MNSIRKLRLNTVLLIAMALCIMAAVHAYPHDHSACFALAQVVAQ